MPISLTSTQSLSLQTFNDGSVIAIVKYQDFISATNAPVSPILTGKLEVFAASTNIMLASPPANIRRDVLSVTVTSRSGTNTVSVQLGSGISKTIQSTSYLSDEQSLKYDGTAWSVDKTNNSNLSQNLDKPISTGNIAFPYAEQANNLMAALGDSISAGSHFNGITTNICVYYSSGVISWMQAFSMGAIECPHATVLGTGVTLFSYNRAVTGETTAQVLARVPEIDNLPVKPKYCNVLCGTNNLQLNIGQPASQIAADIFDICQALWDRGIIPILCTILPRGLWGGGMTAPQITTARGILLETNRMLRAFAMQNYNRLIFVDWYRAFLDPASATNDPLSTWTTDLLHPNTTGASGLGLFWWNVVKNYVTIPAPYKFTGTTDLYNATENPNGTIVDSSWIANGGTAGTGVTAGAGGIPSGWTSQRSGGAASTAVVNLQVRSDGDVGNEVLVTATGVEACDFITFPGSSALAGANFVFDTVAYRIRGEIEHNSVGAAANLGKPPTVFWRVGSPTITVGGMHNLDGLPALPGATPLKYLVQSPIFIIPTGTNTTNNWHLDMSCKAGGVVTNTKFSNAFFGRYDRTYPNALQF
ncbi:MAG: GDSL-type esterase/lipase family protein [Candidatus Margulisiibacteriota bacterium]